MMEMFKYEKGHVKDVTNSIELDADYLALALLQQCVMINENVNAAFPVSDIIK